MDRDTVNLISHFQKKGKRVLFWSEILCLFSLTYAGVVVMDKTYLSPSSHLGREHMAISITKTKTTKIETGHRRYNGVFKISVGFFFFSPRDL